MSATALQSSQLSRYNREAILSAPPARLLTMLYDRLLLDLHRAEQAQQCEDWNAATENLLHAQDIIHELKGSLHTDGWDGTESLLGVYDYVLQALVNANIHRDVERTREAIQFLEPLRQSWHQASALLPAQAQVGLGLGVG